MSDPLFKSSDDFYYDIGYYNYIVINGDKDALNKLLKALGEGDQPGGLGWKGFGPSIRPANDGKTYKWYIRLTGKPRAQVVDEFLRQFLEQPKPGPRPPETQKVIRDPLMETLEHYEHSVEDLKQDFNEAKNEMQASSAILIELKDTVDQGLANRVELAETQKKLKDANLEIARLEQENNDLTVKIESKSSTAADSFSAENKDLDKTLRKAKKAHRAQIKEKNLRIRQLENERDNWQSQFTDASAEIGRLQEQPDEVEQARESGDEISRGTTTESRSADVSLEVALGALVPQLKLVNNSWDYLKFGILNHEPVLRRLRSIVWDDLVPGSKVFEGADDWMELHIDRRLWRLYYCRKDSLVGDKVVAMIGKKGDQKSKDEQWLRNNPPAVALKNEMERRRSNL